MKKLILIVSMFQIWNTLNGQSTNNQMNFCEIPTPNQQSNYASSINNSSSCDQTSNAFISNYANQTYYPIINSEPIKTIPIDIVVFGDDDGSDLPFHIAPNYLSVGNTIEAFPNYLNNNGQPIVTYYNSTFQVMNNPFQISSKNSEYFQYWVNLSYEHPQHPTGNVDIWGNNDYTVPFQFQINNQSILDDSKIRIKINHYYIYYNTNLNSIASDDDVMNFHFQNAPDSRNHLTCFLRKNIDVNAGGYSNEIIMNGEESPIPYVMSISKLNNSPFDLWADVSSYFHFKGHLTHEIGHHLGLVHTYHPSCCHELLSGPDFLDDVFPNPPIYFKGKNIMGGKDAEEISDKQIGRMNRVLHINEQDISQSGYNTGLSNQTDTYLSFIHSTRNFAYGYSATPHEITSNETWDFICKSYNDIVIKKGTTLTLQCRLEMVPEARIVVEEGGKLVIDGGIVTSALNAGPEHEGLWKGIEVWGDPTKNQTSFNAQGVKWQGVVQMKNGAIIENAYIGILANNGTLTAGGGVLDIQNSTFRNCWKSIEINTYPNFQNMSMIKRNTFETTHILANGQWPQVFIDGFHFKGVKIYGNTFIFKAANDEPDQMHNFGTGIYLESAQALINGISTSSNIDYCDPSSSNWTPNKFIGLFKGVVLKNIGLNYTSVVNKNYFSNCVLAISNDGMNATTITQNRIELGSAPNQSPAIVNGILQSVGTGFKIEANCIERLGSNFINSAGIIVNNTGGDNNTVYRNISIGNKTAFLSNEKNRSSMPEAGGKFRGLQFKCNQNTNNATSQNYDLAVATNTSGSTDPLSGIRYYQGGNGTSSNPQAAGNEFTPQAVNIYNNTLNPIVYFYDPASSSQEPFNFSFNVSKSPGSPNQCPSTIGSGDGGLLSSSEYNQLLANYAIHNSQFLATAIFYNNIIDGGSTQNLLQSITNNSNLSVNDIRNLLLSNSPNVSEEVLREAAVSNTLLSNTDLLVIIAANPDVAHSEELLYMLQNKANPMDEWMIEFLREAGTYETNRTLLEQTFAQKQAERDADAWGVVRHLLSDTLNDILNHAELRSWLAAIGSPRAKYMIADDYASQNNYDAAINLVQQMSDKELDRYELTERNGMLQWYSLLKQLYLEGKSIGEVQQDLQNLAPLANNQRESGMAGIIAANVLNKYSEGTYQTEIVYPENSTARVANATPKKQRTLKRYKQNTQLVKNETITLSPNPVRDIATIDLTNLVSANEIRIFDSKGVFVLTQKATSTFMKLDLSSFANGFYSCSIIDSNGTTIKIIKLELLHN